MKGYVVNLEKAARENGNFRKVIYTAKNSQLVLMSIPPMKELGKEVHNVDQFIGIEEGEGRAVLNSNEEYIESGYGIVIPAGLEHNIINTSPDDPLKLFTIYSPPEHRDGAAHVTKQDADESIEKFDGKTTEK